MGMTEEGEYMQEFGSPMGTGMGNSQIDAGGEYAVDGELLYPLAQEDR